MVNVAGNLGRLDIDRARLARKTGLAPARIEAIFAGASPSVDELRLIAGYLRLPIDALPRIGLNEGRTELRYRSTQRTKSFASADARVHEIGRLLSKLPLRPVRNAPLRVTATLEDRSSVEVAAREARRAICEPDEYQSPLPDLADRLDHAGISSTIVLKELDVEGASTQLQGCGLIVVAERTFHSRMLFTCAHELAHVILGHVNDGTWLLDEDTEHSYQNENGEERLCNAIASALLMPADAVAHFLKYLRANFEFRADAISDTEVLLLARYFGTSFLAAATRLEQLSLLPIGGSFALHSAITEDDPSVEAYAEKHNFPPRTPVHIPVISERLRKMLRDAIEDGRVSLGRVADVLGYSIVETTHALA